MGFEAWQIGPQGEALACLPSGSAVEDEGSCGFVVGFAGIGWYAEDAFREQQEFGPGRDGVVGDCHGESA